MGKLIVRLLQKTVSGYLHQQELSRLKSYLNPPEKPLVLDIGCADGSVIDAVEKCFKPKKFIGIDSDQKLIACAQKRSNQEKYQFMVADARSLPFQNYFFDLILISAVLHHIEDWFQALSEAARVLKPGGYLIIREHLKPAFRLPMLMGKVFYMIDKPAALFEAEDLKQALLNIKDLEIIHWQNRGFYKKFFSISIECICRKYYS